MHLTWGTTAATRSFGSAKTSSASTHHSEGTTSMLRQQETDVHSVTVRAQAGGGGASPRLTKLRPFATAGVLLLGAGFVVVTPATTPPFPDPPNTQSRAVRLTDAWTDVFNTASENATRLMNNFFVAPGVGMQQVIANDAGFVQQVLNDPSSMNAVMQQIQANLDTLITGYGLQNATSATEARVIQHTIDGNLLSSGHYSLFTQASTYMTPDEAAAATPIINFLGSPASGIIMGTLGPFISPWVALLNSMTDGDSFSDTLTNMVGASFNGATLDLDSLLPTINGLGFFPAGMSMDHLDIGFGGLLSPGSVGSAGGEVGGSIFNSIGLNFSGVPALGTLDAPSQPIGPIGAWEAWGQVIATLLGWDGTGSPLSDATLPVIPDDLADVGGASATAMDLSSLWQDVLALL